MEKQVHYLMIVFHKLVCLACVIDCPPDIRAQTRFICGLHMGLVAPTGVMPGCNLNWP